MNPRSRGRVQLLLIASMFLIPGVVALVMAFTGWAPKAVSYGQPVQPERSVANVAVSVRDGRSFAWSNDDAKWTLVALPGPDCAQRCLNMLDLAHRAKISLGRSAGNLRLLYLGDPPPAAAIARGLGKAWILATTSSGAFADERPSHPDSLSAVLVTPDGKAFMRYAANFDVSGLRDDLAKVVH